MIMTIILMKMIILLINNDNEGINKIIMNNNE